MVWATPEMMKGATITFEHSEPALAAPLFPDGVEDLSFNVEGTAENVRLSAAFAREFLGFDWRKIKKLRRKAGLDARARKGEPIAELGRMLTGQDPAGGWRLFNDLGPDYGPTWMPVEKR